MCNCPPCTQRLQETNSRINTDYHVDRTESSDDDGNGEIGGLDGSRDYKLAAPSKDRSLTGSIVEANVTLPVSSDTSSGESNAGGGERLGGGTLTGRGRNGGEDVEWKKGGRRFSSKSGAALAALPGDSDTTETDTNSVM